MAVSQAVTCTQQIKGYVMIGISMVLCEHACFVVVVALQEPHITNNCDSHFVSRWYHKEVDVNVL